LQVRREYLWAPSFLTNLDMVFIVFYTVYSITFRDLLEENRSVKKKIAESFLRGVV